VRVGEGKGRRRGGNLGREGRRGKGICRNNVKLLPTHHQLGGGFYTLKYFTTVENKLAQ